MCHVHESRLIQNYVKYITKYIFLIMEIKLRRNFNVQAKYMKENDTYYIHFHSLVRRLSN